MTPAELIRLFEGWAWRERRMRENAASFVSILVRPHVKGRVRVDDILGRAPNTHKSIAVQEIDSPEILPDPERRKKEWEELKARFDKRGDARRNPR